MPIYYEARVAKITLDEGAVATLDEEFDEATEALGSDDATAVAKKWVRVEALVGADKRSDTVVQDILTHFDARLAKSRGCAQNVAPRVCAPIRCLAGGATSISKGCWALWLINAGYDRQVAAAFDLMQPSVLLLILHHHMCPAPGVVKREKPVWFKPERIHGSASVFD